jgi:hypothetical protein
MLWGVFGPKRDEVTKGCINCVMRRVIVRTVHRILLGGQIKKDKMLGHASSIKVVVNAHKLLIRKPEGNIALERPRCKR